MSLLSAGSGTRWPLRVPSNSSDSIMLLENVTMPLVVAALSVSEVNIKPQRWAVIIEFSGEISILFRQPVDCTAVMNIIVQIQYKLCLLLLWMMSLLPV